MEKPTAIILAGGKSLRMGEDKGLMPLNGKPMIQWVIDAVLPLTRSILIAANNPNYEQFAYPLIVDVHKNKGPLAGVVNGLMHSDSELNWVISCDSPFVETDFLAQLIAKSEGVDAVVPVFQGQCQPLIAVYRQSALNHLKENLALNRLKMMDALSVLNVAYFNADYVDQNNFKNLNSRVDL